MYATQTLSADMLGAAKWAFSTRRFTREHAVRLQPDLGRARPGDLVVGRVLRIGSHKRIQLAEGRPSQLYRDDLVVLACGARYAPDQFEGVAELSARGADMLAGGGVLGRMRERNAKMSEPTRIVPLGLLANRDGRVCNVGEYALANRPRTDAMTVVGVVGASMNSGKTTAVASLVHGLKRAGHRVAAIKATGTGAFGDFNAYCDAGADYVADFVDVGMASTYLQPTERIVHGTDTLLAHAGAAGCDVAVVELADGVLQRETATLLADSAYRARFAGWIYAAPDALAAAGGVSELARTGITPAILTGMVSASPMAAREAHDATGIRIVTREALLDPAHAAAILRVVRSSAPQAQLEAGAAA